MLTGTLITYLCITAALAKDLNAAGVDLDYEEMWHADYFKVGDGSGPWELPQTTYKSVSR